MNPISINSLGTSVAEGLLTMCRSCAHEFKSHHWVTVVLGEYYIKIAKWEAKLPTKFKIPLSVAMAGYEFGQWALQPKNNVDPLIGAHIQTYLNATGPKLSPIYLKSINGRHKKQNTNSEAT
jgi:hypothetical protein